MNLEISLALLTGINVILAIINTYWAYQRTCYNRETLRGSEEYWESWEKRRLDVASQVLKEMGIDSLEDLKKLIKKVGKKTKKRK